MKTQLLLFASALLLASCASSAPAASSSLESKDSDASVSEPIKSEVRLTGIELTKAPNKVAYKEGETFDPEGMVISAVYSDSTKKEITDYVIENKALAKGIDAISVSYQGFQVSVPITVRYTLLVLMAGEDNFLNLYSDHTTVFMEGSDYETIVPFEVLASGDIRFNVPSAIAGMLTMSFARKGGKALVFVHQSYGGDSVFEASLIEYNEAFGLERVVAYQETSGTSSFVIYDTLEAVLTLDGQAKEGKVTYEEGSKNAFAFVDKDGNKTEATTGNYDNVFTLAETFVLTDSLVRELFGFTIASFQNEKVGLYFYADGSLGVVLKETPVVELPYTVNFWKYDNSDLMNLNLTLSSMVPAAYGGPSFVCEYDQEEDVVNVTITRGEANYAIAIDGTALDRVLGDYAEIAVLYTLTATEAKRGNDPIDASNFSLFITEKAIELSMYSAYTESYNTLASGAWQFNQESGFGFALTGEYVKNGFAHGGFNGVDQLSVTIELTIQSASEVTFTVDAAEYSALAAALA